LDGVHYHSASGMPLIKDVTLTLTQGPRTVIIGPNGAGKSLLLRLCHGLISPSQGRIAWAEPEAGRHRPPMRHAMVFQRPVMLRRSVEANVEYALRISGMAAADRQRIVRDVLEKTGLGRHANAPARLLSFGEQQKLALARAWALKPEVLFLDEPTASLDPSAKREIEALIDEVAAAGMTVVMSTHNLGQARRHAQRVVYLEAGRLVVDLPAERFFTERLPPEAELFLKGELPWR
jgi:tungstate transport system ATP-binding protein